MREHISNVNQIIEEASKYNKLIYLCYIDYEKAFDNVKWNVLRKNKQALDVPKHLIRVVELLT